MRMSAINSPAVYGVLRVSPPAADVRATVLDPLQVTAEQDARLHGRACARCGSTFALRPGGYAYTSSGTKGGRLGWAVKLCADCPGTGA